MPNGNGPFNKRRFYPPGGDPAETTPKAPSIGKDYASRVAGAKGDFTTMGQMAGIDISGWDTARQARQKRVGTKYNIGKSSLI